MHPIPIRSFVSRSGNSQVRNLRAGAFARSLSRRLLASCLVVGAVRLGALTAQASPQGCLTNEVLLNTGYDHLNATVLPIGVDPRWTVVTDPFANTKEPRPAAVINKNPAWKAAEPLSQWISGYPTSVQSQNGIYEFETVFCLHPDFALAGNVADLVIGMRADDACSAYLNGDTEPFHIGQTFKAASLTTTTYALTDIGAVPGANTLRIRVNNLYSVAMGLNLAAKVVTSPSNTAEKPSCCSPNSAIQGVKYHDLNGNGVRDPGEPGLAGWVIEVLDPSGSTLVAITDSEGYYSFVDLLPGWYTVSEVQQSGWQQTAPSTGTYGFALLGLQGVGGLDFGNIDVGPCATDEVLLNTGYDHAGGGILAIGDADPRWILVQDPFASTTEPRPATVVTKYPGWQDPEPDSQWISGYPSSVQGHNGAYIFETVFCLAPGFDDPLNDAQLVIGMRADDGCSAFLNGNTTPFHTGQAFNAASMTVSSYSLGGLGGVVGQNTLRIQVDNTSNVAMGLDVVASVNAPSDTAEKPECCTNVGVLQGVKFQDLNSDGIRNFGEPALAGWQINLVGSNGVTSSIVTDSAGYYSFVDLAPATYTLTETMQTGWVQTAPSSGSHVVTLTGIQGVSALDFGNLETAVTIYCTSGTSTNGCVPTIDYSGTPSLSNASGFTLEVSNLEGQKAGLFFYGLSAHTPVAWGNGSSFLCVKAPSQRFALQNSGGMSGQCTGVLSADWLAYIASHPFALGVPFSAGDVVYAQAWYRDPPAPKTTNLSDAIQFTLMP